MPEFKPRNTARARALRNTATPAERHLWRYLSASQLGAKFSRQMPVGPYFVDFLCRSHKLVVELDGYSHETRVEYDAARDQWLADNGYHLLRFTNEAALRETEGVLAHIREAIARPGPPLAPPASRGAFLAVATLGLKLHDGRPREGEDRPRHGRPLGGDSGK